MIRRSPISTIIILIVSISLLTAALVWGNYRLAQANPGGEHFLVDWFSARSLFIDGVNPYSETAQENMQAFAKTEQVKLTDDARFDAPLYSAFITLPLAVINDYPLARAVWMTVLEALMVGIVLMSLSLARWKLRPIYVGLLILFALFWFHGFYPILSGSTVVVATLIVASVFLAVRERQYEFAGVLLGLATIQLHATALFILFVLYWSLRYRKGKIVVWFFASVLLLSAMAALIRPQWFLDYLRVLVQPTNSLQTITQVFKSFLPAAGLRVGLILLWLTGIILFIEWFVSKKEDFNSFYWTGLLTLALSPWIGLRTEPVMFLVSFPAIIYAMSLWNERWPRTSIALITVVVILLFGGIWLMYLTQAEKAVSTISGLYFAQPFLVTIMLYWVRWWAIRKPNVWFDQLTKG